MASPLWAPRGQGVCRSTWFVRPQRARPQGCSRVVSVGCAPGAGLDRVLHLGTQSPQKQWTRCRCAFHHTTCLVTSCRRFLCGALPRIAPNSPKPRNHGMHFLYKGPPRKEPGDGSSASGDHTWDRTALCHWDPTPESSLMLPFQPRGERGPAESARPEPVTQAPSLWKALKPLL